MEPQLFHHREKKTVFENEFVYLKIFKLLIVARFFSRFCGKCYQVVSSSGNVNEKDSKISNLGPKFRAPRDFALQNHFVGVDVVEVRPLRQEEHSSFRKESFFLVKNALLHDQVAFDESVVLVVLRLFVQPGINYLFVISYF